MINFENRVKTLTLAISTPVKDLTTSGTRETIVMISPVSLAAPISPAPLETIVIFFAWDNGAATSAATYVKTFGLIFF